MKLYTLSHLQFRTTYYNCIFFLEVVQLIESCATHWNFNELHNFKNKKKVVQLIEISILDLNKLQVVETDDLHKKSGNKL